MATTGLVQAQAMTAWPGGHLTDSNWEVASSVRYSPNSEMFKCEKKMCLRIAAVIAANTHVAP